MGAKLLIAFLAAATSCHKHYYGTSYDLSTRGRVIAWPVDEQGKKFRYAVDHLPRPLQLGRIHHLDVGDGPIRAELPEPVDSVLVVLPPEPEPAQRRGAERIVDWVVGQDGGAAAHIIVGFESWKFVRDVVPLAQSLAKLEERTAHRLEKFGSSFEPSNDAVARVIMQMMSPFTPSFIVVPVRHHPGEFAVIQVDLHEGGHDLVTHTKTAEEAADYALANFDGAQIHDVLGPDVRVPPTLHFVLARDAPPALRDECIAAAQRLSTRVPDGQERPFMVVFRTSSLTQAELSARGTIEKLAKSGELLPFGRDTERTE